MFYAGSWFGVRLSNDVQTLMLALTNICKYHRAMCTGSPSAFDLPEWLEVMPLEIETPLLSIRMLRKHSKQMMIQVPRLTCYVRSLREDPSLCLTDVADRTVDLATVLYNLDAKGGETDILHNVKVIKTIHPQDATIIPWSLHFNNFPDFEAVVVYWTSRLLLLTLYKTILSIPGLVLAASIEDVHAEQEYIVMNVMMSWQYALSIQPFGAAGIPLQFAATWSALDGRVGDVCGYDVTDIRSLLLLRLDDFMDAWRMYGYSSNEEDLSQQAALMAGGPLEAFWIHWQA